MDEKIKNFMDKLPRFVKLGGFVIFAFVLLLIALTIIFPSPRLPNNTLTGERGSLVAPQSTGSAGTNDSFYGEGVAQKNAAAPSPLMPSTEPGYQGQVTPETEKKVIKTGDISLVVESSSAAAEKIGNIAVTNGGFVLSSDIYKTSTSQEEGYVSVKVPFDKFESTLKEIKEVASQIKSETVSASDVTQEYVDLQAQIKNYESEEAQYREIMKHAVKISDVLEVQAKLSEVRRNIDSLQGRLNYLASQTDMSLITVRLSETPVVTLPQDQWQITTTVKEAFKELIQTAQDFLDGLVFFVIVTIPSLIPTVLILWLIYYIIRFFWKRFKSSDAGKKEPPAPVK